MYKLGKLPARPNAVTFSLHTYLKKPPTAPAEFGSQATVKTWGMLGNDQYGDCVLAGGDHEHLMWTHATNQPDATFTDKTALSDYAALTGFNPADPNTDQGTDMAKAAAYRRKTGLIDAKGKRHKVAAYLAIRNYTNTAELADAAYLFGAVGVGIQFPDTAMQQFNAGKTWDVVSGSHIEGGHYVPLVGRLSSGNFLVVTWGKVQQVTPRFLTKYVDEAITYLTPEWVNTTGKTLDGFTLPQLQQDLAAL